MYHVAERINLWWSCYNLTRRLATVTGLPDGLPDSPDIVSRPIFSVWRDFNLSTLKVTTVFPAPFSQVEQVSQAVHPFDRSGSIFYYLKLGFGAWTPGSVQDLFQLQPQPLQARNDSALSLCAKSAVLNARMQSYLVSLPCWYLFPVIVPIWPLTPGVFLIHSVRPRH